MQQQKYRACSKCGEKKVLSGHNAQHNGRSTKTGTVLCPDCIIAEIYERYKK